MRELIYKDEAYKAIDNCICDSWYRISPADAKMNIRHLISDANEADRPSGEWIDKGDYAECSNCGGNSGTQFDGVEPIPLKTKFCPNCGAQMKGADNETAIS